MYALYRLLFTEETRKKILGMDKLIKLATKFTKYNNNRIVFITLNFLDVVQLFEPKYHEKVIKLKFKILNKEFIEHVESLESQAEGNEMEYYDD